MKKAFLLPIFIFFSFQIVNAQLNYSEKETLSILLLKRVNDLRIKLGKKELKRDPDLVKSAVLHSDYMADNNSLNHNQIGTKYPKPKDRILHFNKSFVSFGENVLYSKPIRFPINKKALEKIAFDMFRAWKSSPRHYANMISDNYTYSDLGFSYHSKSKRIFATHVFGKKGYIIPNQLSPNAFSILPEDKTCSDFLNNKYNLIVNIGNRMSIENGEIIYRDHNIETLQKFLQEKNDGLAIDLVTRDQMLCDKENILDASEIYDGIMLKPVYKDNIFSNNTAKNKKRLVVSLGKIPEHLNFKEVSPNVILIKDGKKCSYSQFAYIPSKRYDLRSIPPILYRPKITLKTEGIKTINKIHFDFESGKITPQKTPTIHFEISKLHSIDIKSFTSIDGNASINEKLHKGRADYINNYLINTLKIDKTPITIDAKENWNLCNYQLELLGLEDQFNNKKEIRVFVKNNKTSFWKRALKSQRKSKAILYQYGSWTVNDPHFLNYNLIDAVLTENFDLANNTLAKMYDSNHVNLFLDEEFMTNKLFNKKELVQNVSALLLKNIEKYDLNNIVFFVRNWLSHSKYLSENAQKNLLNLYAITSKQLLRDWDTSIEDFSKVLHPKKVKPLFDNYKSDDIVNPLFLNFHMASIEYYAQINYSPKIRESFDFITNYFREISLTIEDDIDLALFFNSWSMYHLTNESLLHRYHDKTLNEKATFLLLQTYISYNINSNPETIFNLNKLAIQFNKNKWCKWINRDFLNLRNEGIKNLYCKTCKN